MSKQYKKFQTQFHLGFGNAKKPTPALAEEYFAFVDLFAGAGGVTTGAEAAELDGQKIAQVICAINHDRKAIESHWQNHPHVKHFSEDIKKFDTDDLPKVRDPRAKKFLWASLECTNFSNAKGGLPRDPDSRTLAEHLPRYVKAYNPDYIGIENVREFMDWGPLTQMVDETEKPMFYEGGEPMLVPDRTMLGIDYKKWIKKMCRLGYHHEEKILNAADFGAHTSRKRLFIIFAKHELPIEWPEPTHSKKGISGKQRWKPVKECLDFSVKGENIFNRKKNLSDNTYKRIYAGLLKFIANGDESFITKWMGNNEFTGINNGKSVNEPCITVTTQNRIGLVQPEFLVKYHGNGKNIVSTDEPSSTLTQKDRLGLVQSEFLLNYQHSSDVNDIEKPSPTIVTKDKYAIVQTEHFIAKYNSSHNNTKQNAGSEINNPSPTVTARPGLGLVSVDHFIDMQHGQGKQNQSIDDPSGAILTVPKKNLVTVEHFIDQQYGQSKPQGVDTPSNAIVANPKQNLVTAFLLNRQYNNIGSSIENPCFTLIAQMNKRPGYLIQLETGDVAIAIEEEDTEIMRKIKIFMAAYGIIAIYMRMLMIPELLKITGLPEDYILVGTQGDKKKFIGNAVPPALPKAMLEALALSLKKMKATKAA